MSYFLLECQKYIPDSTPYHWKEMDLEFDSLEELKQYVKNHDSTELKIGRILKVEEIDIKIIE